MPAALLVAAGAAAAGGIAGAIAQSNARSDAKQQIQEAIDTYQKAGLPPDLSTPIILQQFKQQGIITPAEEQEINMQVSRVSQVQANPQLQQAQMSALQQMGGVAQGGLRPEDRAAFLQLQNEANRQTEGQRQAIMQNMAARGIAGGGAELAGQLQAAQGGANQLAQSGDALSSQASQRALQAIGQYGGMAGQMGQQQFGQDVTRAQAADALSQFNVANSRAVQERNIQAQNAAQAANLAQQQRSADINVQQANTEAQRQKQAQGQYYQNLQNYYSGLAGIKMGQAQQARQSGAEAAQSYQGIGSGLGSAALGYQQQLDYANRTKALQNQGSQAAVNRNSGTPQTNESNNILQQKIFPTGDEGYPRQ